MAKLDSLAKEILADVLADFRDKKLGSEALRDGYIGAPLFNIEEKYCGKEGTGKVDFDLALKELETNNFVNTGPMEPYKSDPNSGILIIALFSKREYVYLTEKGYRAAQQSKSPVRPTARTTVNISGGNFHQSPIGLGYHVTQSASINFENSPEVIDHLLQLLARSGTPADEATRREVIELVDVTNKGDIATAKPIFQAVWRGDGKREADRLGRPVGYHHEVTKQLGL